MAGLLLDSPQSPQNLLDLVEELVSANDWTFQRANAEELMAAVSGNWCDYRLYFGWVEEVGAMQFSMLYDMRVPQPGRAAVYPLLALINERLLVGHFELSAETGSPTFRHAMLLRGALQASVEQLEDLVDIAISECERFFPAFQLVLWGGKSAHEAFEAALIETVGEA